VDKILKNIIFIYINIKNKLMSNKEKTPLEIARIRTQQARVIAEQAKSKSLNSNLIAMEKRARAQFSRDIATKIHKERINFIGQLIKKVRNNIKDTNENTVKFLTYFKNSMEKQNNSLTDMLNMLNKFLELENKDFNGGNNATSKRRKRKKKQTKQIKTNKKRKTKTNKKRKRKTKKIEIK